MTKVQIITKLVREGHLDIEEALILMDKEVVIQKEIQYLPAPTIQPYIQAPYSPTLPWYVSGTGNSSQPYTLTTTNGK